MSKRILSLVLALVMVLGTFGTVFAAPTDNVRVDWLIEEGLVKGYGDGSYGLDKAITRAEVATMVVRALGFEEDAAKMANIPSVFPDMRGTNVAWANGYVNLAVGKGIINGYEDGTFKPSKDISYAEVAAILVRALDGMTPEEIKAATGRDWATTYLVKAAELGVLDDVVIADFNAKAQRQTIFEMVYNTINKGFGRYTIVKGIVLENNRVEKLTDANQVVVEVLKEIQTANFAKASRLERGDQEKFAIEAKVGDVEYLLGKVADFTLDKDNKVIKVTVDESYEYWQGEVTATKNKIGGFTVELDERYKDRDERIFRTYHNDKAYAYEDFYKEVKGADFARITSKNGKVLFIDSFTFEDVAPVKEVKKDGTELYVYNDLRDGEIKRLNLSPSTKVIAVDEGMFSRSTVDKINELEVVHVYGNNKVLVRKDAKTDGKFTKVIENKNGHFVVVEGEEHEILDKDNMRAVYSYDSKQFFTLYPKTADRALREFKDENVTVLLDVNGNVQYMGSEIEIGEYVAGIDAIVGREARVVKADNTKADLMATLDTYIKLEGSTAHNNLNRLDKQDIVYVSTDDKNIDKLYRLAQAAVVKANAKTVVKNANGSYVVNRNFIETDRQYKILDRTNVFYYAGGNVYGTTIDKIVRDSNNAKNLEAYVITDFEYDRILDGAGKRATTNRSDIANTIIFTDVTFKSSTSSEIVEILEILSSGYNYEIQYRTVDGEVVYKDIVRGSAAYKAINDRGLNQARKDFIGSITRITKDDSEKVNVLDMEILIKPVDLVYEVVSTRSESGYRYVTLRDRNNVERQYWISRDVKEFGNYGTTRARISFSQDSYGEVNAILVRAANAPLSAWDGSVIKTNVLMDVIETSGKVLLRIDNKLYEYAGSVPAARALIGQEVAFDVQILNGVEFAYNLRAKDSSSPITKQDLENAIAAGNLKVEADYTPASWLVFNNALNAAKIVNNNPMATQAQITNATSLLNAAMTGLVPVAPATVSATLKLEFLGIKSYELTFVNALATDVTRVMVDGVVNTNTDIVGNKLLVNVTSGTPTSFFVTINGVEVPVTIN